MPKVMLIVIKNYKGASIFRKSSILENSQIVSEYHFIHGFSPAFPVTDLAKNTAMGKLATLNCH